MVVGGTLPAMSFMQYLLGYAKSSLMLACCFLRKPTREMDSQTSLSYVWRLHFIEEPP